MLKPSRVLKHSKWIEFLETVMKYFCRVHQCYSYMYNSYSFFKHIFIEQVLVPSTIYSSHGPSIRILGFCGRDR